MSSLKLQSDSAPKPFLRWAGGKNWLIRHLSDILNCQNFNNYHEPFLGGGAIFFHLKPKGTSYLTDLNQDLIGTYQSLKDDVHSVIKELRKFENTEKEYYRLRDSKLINPYRRAARFIYLNQTSFNGIYRVNLSGKYNVPYGYRDKNFLEEDNLISVSHLLQNAEIDFGDFGRIISNVKKDDLVFLDPPYTVSHNNNGFIKYNQNLFSLEDQYRLADTIKAIKKKKAFYILTNAAHKKISEIFSFPDDCKLVLSRTNLIGGVNAKRGKTSEFIFTNIPQKR